MKWYEILGVFGGITTASTGLATFFSYLILNKLKINWQKGADLEIEKKIAEMDKNREEIISILSNFAQTHDTSQNKRIESVEKLWNNVLHIRQLNESTVFFFNILKPEEYITPPYNQFIKDLVNRIPSKEKLANESKTITNKVDNCRPFINEYLWSLFFLYSAFSTRISLRLKLSFQEGKIREWYKDKVIKTHLEAAFSSDELESIDFESIYAIRIVIQRLEEKILKECSKIITGDYATQESIKQSRKIKEAIEKSETIPK